jgi:hypothetical protein
MNLRRVTNLGQNWLTDDNGDLLADPHSILNRWKNYFCQLLTVHGIKDVWQTEIHTGKPLEPESISFQAEIATEKLKRCKLPDIDHSVAELIHTGGIHYILRSTNVLILFEIRKNCQNCFQHPSVKVNSICR